MDDGQDALGALVDSASIDLLPFEATSQLSERMTVEEVLADRPAWMSVFSAAEAVGQWTAPERPADRLVPRWADCAAVAFYLALAFWVTSGLWRHVGALALVNGGSNVHFFEWALVHAARIFTHGENPLFTTQMNAPNGVNMMANTGLLGLTVPLAPVTLLFGPAIVVLSPYAPHYDDLRDALNQLTGQPTRQVQGLLLWEVGK